MKNEMRSASSPSRPAAPTAGLPMSWPEEIHRILREQNIRQIAYVPDSGHARLIDMARSDRQMRAIPLTTEEEGVALAVGAWLGGEKSVLLLQSSGVGNCINMLGTVEECRVPLLMLVTMRGQWGEFNPWQVPMAQGTAPALAGMSVVVQTVDDPADVAETVDAAARLAFNTYRAVAVLIGQRVIGAKAFGK
ncbi:MAG: phosphonopyruvate decarboxylase [Burkholderiales bacterium]|jgi:sulfopyruvate decarboxylase alpha subunit|nr:phosphonopyruvate decarboxylase [Burkholderiales bacterium]